MRGTRNRRRVVAAAAATVLAVSAIPAGATPTLQDVADGVISPLGLAVSETGTIYVAEAFVGQLTAIEPDGRRRTVAETADGSTAGVDARGRDVAFTLSVFPEDGSAPDTTLNRLLPNGSVQRTTSLLAFEESANPDGDAAYGFVDGLDDDCATELDGHPFVQAEPYLGIVESNPYAVAIDGGDRIVADAAGNSLVRVRANGRVDALAVLPPIPQTVTADAVAEYGLPDCVLGATYAGEPVPTDVEVGPDGHYYVSTLPGFPETPGAGTVFRVHRRTGAVTQVASGFTFAVDLAVTADGTIYVAELVTDFATLDGRISRIRGGVVEPVVEAPMLLPSAIEVARVGKRETIYAAVEGMFGPGRIVIVTP